MKTLRIAVAVSMMFVAAACGDSGTGGTGGRGGSGGGATAGAGGGGGAGGAGGGGGSGVAGATGSAGATGAGGSGNWATVCPACVSCVMTSCASQLATCQANTSCNALYECGRACATPINDCVAQHLDAITVWAQVSACLNANCRTICGF